MFKLVAILACACALAFAGTAAAGLALGVAEDATKYSDDGGSFLFAKLLALGGTENRMVVYWDHTRPADIQERAFLDRSLPVAAAFGVRVVFAVYPRDPLAFAAATDARVAEFAAYLRLLAFRYPQVRTYVLLNEPNERFFLGPQAAAPEIAMRVLAAGYDALKRVDPGIAVAGLGLSPEGNDTTSTSPVRFLAALGRAYERSGRAAPLMDELALHLYPRDASREDETTRAGWPNVGAADLDRVKQAVWDAFAGTAQPVFPERRGGGTLSLRVGEVGWQVAATGPAYTGTETVAVADERRQAAVYGALVRRLACDPAVSALSFFHLADDADLRQYQSGLLRADGSERPSYAAVRAAHAEGCRDGATAWSHSSGVSGAAAFFGPGGVSALAREDAEGVGALLRVAGPARLGPGQAARALGGLPGSAVVVASTRRALRAGSASAFGLPAPTDPGWYAYAVRLTAWANPERSQTLVGAVFRVG